MLYFTNKKGECTGCGACAAICPQNCISFEYDDEGFSYPVADNNCINCGKCYSICPLINKKSEDSSDFKQFCVAARHLDDNIWERSASGGAFSAICEAYCNEGDGIFGAKFEGLKVIHDCVYSPDDIECFRKSKYVQSDMKDSYGKIKDMLERDHNVLFFGTPCQVAGVRSFLGKEYENLLCVDLVCHGVGSPGIFKRYNEYLEKRYKSKVVSFTFRNKKVKMGRLLQYVIIIEFENGMRIEEDKNLYNTAFIQALFLRPSCEECKFANIDRGGDITIADFKRKHELLPKAKELDNFSTIIINTEKGKETFKKLQEFMKLYSVNIDDVVRENSPLRVASKPNMRKEDFFHDLRMGVPIEQALVKYITMPSFLMKIWLRIPDRMKAGIKRRTKWIRK